MASGESWEICRNLLVPVLIKHADNQELPTKGVADETFKNAHGIPRYWSSCDTLHQEVEPLFNWASLCDNRVWWSTAELILHGCSGWAEEISSHSLFPLLLQFPSFSLSLSVSLLLSPSTGSLSCHISTQMYTVLWQCGNREKTDKCLFCPTCQVSLVQVPDFWAGQAPDDSSPSCWLWLHRMTHKKPSKKVLGVRCRPTLALREGCASGLKLSSQRRGGAWGPER